MEQKKNAVWRGRMDGAGGFLARSAKGCRQNSRVFCASALGTKRRGKQDPFSVRRRGESSGLHEIRNGCDADRRETFWRARICRDRTDSGTAEKWRDTPGDSNGEAGVGARRLPRKTVSQR